MPEACTPEMYGGFALASRRVDDHDGASRREQRPGPARESFTETDVRAPHQVARREVDGITRVEDLGASALGEDHGAERQRLQLDAEGCLERRMLLPVQICIVTEVGRRFGLVHRDDPDEL